MGEKKRFRRSPIASSGATKLAQEEGIFCGMSSGATLAAALRVAKDAKPGSTFLVMIPDTGERYLSTVLFEDIPEDLVVAFPRGIVGLGFVDDREFQGGQS